MIRRWLHTKVIQKSWNFHQESGMWKKENAKMSIYLYIDIPNDNGIYEVMGRVIDMCLVPNTKVVYRLTNSPKSHETIKYQLSYSLHDTRQVSTKLCKQIVNQTKQNILSIVIYICILRSWKCLTISFNFVFIDIWYFVWQNFVETCSIRLRDIHFIEHDIMKVVISFYSMSEEDMENKKNVLNDDATKLHPKD